MGPCQGQKPELSPSGKGHFKLSSNSIFSPWPQRASEAREKTVRSLASPLWGDHCGFPYQAPNSVPPTLHRLRGAVCWLDSQRVPLQTGGSVLSKIRIPVACRSQARPLPCPLVLLSVLVHTVSRRGCIHDLCCLSLRVLRRP